MKDVITVINSLLRDNVVQALSKLCDAVKKVFEYLDNVRSEKSRKAAVKKENEAEACVRNACREGNLNDLMDSAGQLNKTRSLHGVNAVIAACAFAFANGCSTIDVYTAKQWEGRYSNINEAISALYSAKLNKNESVWILSSQTLERLLITDKE